MSISIKSYLFNSPIFARWRLNKFLVFKIPINKPILLFQFPDLSYSHQLWMSSNPLYNLFPLPPSIPVYPTDLLIVIYILDFFSSTKFIIVRPVHIAVTDSLQTNTMESVNGNCTEHHILSLVYRWRGAILVEYLQRIPADVTVRIVNLFLFRPAQRTIGYCNYFVYCC